MIELFAGILVALAVLSYVLEPLFHAINPQDPSPELVSRMRARLQPQCPACNAASNPGSAFCQACGRPLVR